MKQRDFSSFVGAKAVRFSESHFDLVVQALDHAARNRLLGAKVIEQHPPMLLQTGGDGLEWLEPRAPDALTPTIEELSSPGRRDIAPEVFKGRHQPIGAEGSQARPRQVPHPPAF